MAGVEFAKYGTNSAGEMEVHFDNDIRSNSSVNHSNKNIDKTQTHRNYYIGADSYQEIASKIEAIIEKVDQENPPKRLRKDRKTMFSLEVPCPPEIEGTPEEDRFYELVYGLYKLLLPGTSGAVVHKDEKHEYYDPAKKEIVISRNHIHILGATLTNDGRINCKDCISPQMCQKVNAVVQELCLNEWGISYQTGEGRKGQRKTVEQLKGMSEAALEEKLAKENIEVVRNTEETLKNQVNKLREQKTDAKNELADIYAATEDAKNNLAGLKKETEEVEKNLTEKKNFIDLLDDALKNLFTRFNKAYHAMQKIFQHWFDSDRKAYLAMVKRTDPIIAKGNNAMRELNDIIKEVKPGAEITSYTMSRGKTAASNLKEATEELEEIENEYEYER